MRLWCASRRLALTRRRWALLRQQMAVEEQEDVVAEDELEFEVWRVNQELNQLDRHDRARELQDNWDQGGLATELDEDPTPRMPRAYRAPVIVPGIF